VPSSGSPTEYIEISNYGTGNRPRILGSDVATGWTNTTGDIWRTNDTFSNPYDPMNADITFVGMDGSKRFGSYKPSVGDLAAEFDWAVSSGNVYVYSAEDPALRYLSVEIPQRDFGISTYNHEYLHINGIDVAYARWIGIQSNEAHSDHIDLHGLVIENCDIEFIGGISVGGSATPGFGIGIVYSDMTIRNCTIRDCGRRGISLDVYGDGFTASNAIIEDCTIFNGYHTTALDINTGSNAYTAGWDGVIFRRNLVFEDESEEKPLFSNLMFVQRYGDTTLRNVEIYSNVFKFSAGFGIAIESGYDVSIYNNTFYGHNTATTPTYHIYADTRLTNLVVKNNIFHTLLPNDTQGNGAGLVLYGVDSSEVDADHNLYYRSSNDLRIMLINGTSYYMNSIASIRSDLSWELHSPTPADPRFVSSTDYHLQADSPALDAGTDMGLPFEGSAPEIGAFEFSQ
jgi:hypothetical protein